MTDQTRELMLERARVIASTLLTISDATGEAVTPDQVQRVALVKLSPVAVRHSVIAANLVLGVIEQLALSHINAQAERPAWDAGILPRPLDAVSCPSALEGHPAPSPDSVRLRRDLVSDERQQLLDLRQR